MFSECNPPTYPAVIQTGERFQMKLVWLVSYFLRFETPQMRPNVFLCAKEEL